MLKIQAPGYSSLMVSIVDDTGEGVQSLSTYRLKLSGYEQNMIVRQEYESKIAELEKKLAEATQNTGGNSNNATTKKQMRPEYVDEETGISVTKITDDDMNPVLGPMASKVLFNGDVLRSIVAGSKNGGYQWYTQRLLHISPDGNELAYLTRKNKANNIMVCRTTGKGESTQRTFNNVDDFYWGSDDKLYFSDIVDSHNKKIVSIDSHKDSKIRQLTSNNIDFNPATKDGNIIFFTRLDDKGPSIWCINAKSGELLKCARGYQPTPISDNEFLCTRNSTNGNSEIWLVDYVHSKETLIVANKDQGFSNASLSPDGKWILLQANNTKSKDLKKQNLDLFVIRPDGTQLTQLTYHPSDDFCPVWSADGKQIYFISSRGSKNDKFNIWRMNFIL